MGLLTKKQKDTLELLLIELPNIDTPAVRRLLLKDIPNNIRLSVEYSDIPLVHIMAIVNTLNEIAPPPQGSTSDLSTWPILTVMTNAQKSVGGSSLAARLKELQDEVNQVAARRSASSDSASGPEGSANEIKRTLPDVESAELWGKRETAVRETAATHHARAIEERNKGDFAEAVRFYEQARALYEQVGDQHYAATLMNAKGGAMLEHGGALMSRAAQAIVHQQWDVANGLVAEGLAASEGTLEFFRGLGDAIGIDVSESMLATWKTIGALRSCMEAAVHGNLAHARAWLAESKQHAMEAHRSLKLLLMMGMDIQLLGSLFWQIDRLEKALDKIEAMPDYAVIALQQQGQEALNRGDYSKADRLFRQSLHESQQSHDRGGMAQSLYYLGKIAHYKADYSEAQRLYLSALDTARQLGATRSELVAQILNQLGTIAHHHKDLKTAKGFYELSLELWETLDNREAVAALKAQLQALSTTHRGGDTSCKP